MKFFLILIMALLTLVVIAQATKVCPVCGQVFGDDYNFCDTCIVDGKAVKLKSAGNGTESTGDAKVVGPGIKLVKIPGGTFQMGSNEGEADEIPVHSVTVGSFYMAETEVTNQQYCTFLNSKRPDETTRKSWVLIRSDTNVWPTEIWYENGTYRPTRGYENNPVNSVSWYGTDEFCKYYKVRMPTEEEWEYAAGGPNHYKYPWGNSWAEGMCCNNRDWSKQLDPCPTVAVKSYSANGYGLYDMAGNLWEWCSDWYDVYPGGSRTVNMGNKYRVLRGGPWDDVAAFMRCAHRGDGDPSLLGNDYGFRVAAD